MTERLQAWAKLNFANLSKQINLLLLDAGTAEAEQETRLLLAAVFGQDVWQKIAEPELFPDPELLPKLAQLVERRLLREPLSQVLGEKGFWTLDLCINRHVLTPRADSEILVEMALALTQNQTVGSVLDLGTGSGALLLAFLSERPSWRGTGVDISPEALKIAKQNAKTNNLGKRTEFICSDWTTLTADAYDLVLSNPPYIASGELASLEPEVVEFEPKLALDGGVDGLDAYRFLAKNLKKWLRPGGRFILEIGHLQAEAVTGLLRQQSCFTELKTRQDFGSNDRAIAGLLKF